MWIDDAVQDVLVRCWQSGNDLIHRAVIDAARRYGPRTRRGNSRQTCELPEELRAVSDPYDSVDTLLDFRADWRRLQPAERRVLREWTDGTVRSNGHQVRVSKARRHLRALRRAVTI
jgi:hypothetical protein